MTMSTRASILRAVLVAALGTGLSTASADDPLDHQKAQRQIAEQRSEISVQEALREADKLARVSPTRAVEELKKVRLALDLSTQISSEKRDALVKQLDAKITAIQGAPLAKNDPKSKARREAAQKEIAAAQAEAKEVREAVAEIGRLYDANRIPEAQRRLAEVSRKYPNNPALIHLGGLGTVASRVAMAKDLAREQDERLYAVAMELARSNLPARGDLEFPADWAKRDKRKTDQFLKLSPEEEAILEALNKMVKTGVTNAPFEETLQSLSNLIDKPIYLDKKSLEDAGLDLRRPVSIPNNVTARTALRGILQSLGLTFVIKDRVIQVLTLEKARETLVTRAYYLGDVISMVGPFSGAVTWGPLADAQQTQANAQFIVDAIKQSVDPLVWDSKHGMATIAFHYPSLSIIVRAPAEVHASLGSKLGPSK
jgi:hypothetical protein